MSSKIPIEQLAMYVWNERLKIVGFTTIVAVLGALWLLSLPNKFAAQAVFMAESAEGEGGLSSIASSFGGIASLAGINLGSDNQSAIEAEYLLTSEKFLLDIVRDFQLSPQVVAAVEYNFAADAIEYDESIYDSAAEVWSLSGDRKSRVGAYPADWYMIAKLREIVSVSKNEETGLLTLRVEHLSPRFAKQFADLMLSEINRVMKQRESQQLKRRLEYLNEQLQADMPSEIKQSIYALVEQQLKQKMIVDTTDNFIFKIIEQPRLPELKSSPLRALLLILIVILAGGGQVLYYILKYVFFSYREDQP